MSGDVLQADEWLAIRSHVVHDLLRRSVLPWCGRLTSLLCGDVEDPSLDSENVGVVAEQIEELLRCVHWLIENIAYMSPSSIIRSSDLPSARPEEGKDHFYLFIDSAWRSRLGIDSISAGVRRASEDVGRAHGEIRAFPGSESIRSMPQTERDRLVLFVRAFRSALLQLDLALQRLPKRPEVRPA